MNANPEASRIVVAEPDEPVSRRTTLAVAIALTLAGAVALVLVAATATGPTAGPRPQASLSQARV